MDLGTSKFWDKLLFDLESYVSDQRKELSLFLGVFNAEFERNRTRWEFSEGFC